MGISNFLTGLLAAKDRRMPQTRLRDKSQITIPKEIVRALDLSEGDVFEVCVQDGNVVLSPQTMIPKDEAWLLSDEARGSLKRGLNDIQKGRTFGPFTDVDEFLDSLDS